MMSVPLYVKSCSEPDFIDGKQNRYSYAFRKMYVNYDKIDDVEFGKHIQGKYKMTDIEFRSLKSNVISRIKQTESNKAENEQKIIDSTDDLEFLSKKDKSIKNTRRKFKKKNKIASLEKSLPQNITFGGKQTLRELTKLHNKKESAETQLQIEQKTKEWKNKRVLPFYNIGEANRNGNRFFTFDFENNLIIYKPYKGKKIEIAFTHGKKYRSKLLQLQELINNKEIAITVSVAEDKICISFDNEVLSGYYIDKKIRKKEVAEVNKTNLSPEQKKEVINLIYKKHYDDLKKKKLIGKIPERHFSVDLNPDYIGYCVADKGEGAIDKIVEKGFIDFRGLDEKLNLPSDHPLAKKQKNKKKHEVQNAIKELFNIAKHYKCAYFVGEDIDGINKGDALESKEANRKTRNVWHREITNWQIQKRCVELGIEYVPITPVYTSFIGNLMYDYFDPTNAAIEICRRGMFKFEKGLFYPPITGTITDTMSKLFESQKIQIQPRDAQAIKDCVKWGEIYKIAADNGLRWRWDWEKVERPHSIFSMNSAKSKVKIVRFII